MQDWQIWIGFYSLGQGYDETTKPQLLDTVKASSFGVACLLLELRHKLKWLENAESDGKYIDSQSCHWWYHYETNSNDWTGKYFETEEQAWGSFNRI